MDVKDYNQSLASARTKYIEAQDDLKESFAKSTDDLKNRYENKLDKQKSVFEKQRSVLSEQNAINEDRYNEVTKKTIDENQNRFLTDIKNIKSSSESERAKDKQTASEKLTELRSNYERSTLENNRLHDLAKKTMADRYSKNLKTSENEFNKAVKNVDDRSRDQYEVSRLDSRKDLEVLAKSKDKEIAGLRASNVEERGKVLNRLRADNEEQRQSFDSDLKNLQTQQELKLKDMTKVRIGEGESNQNTFSNLQEDIKKRNLYEQEKMQKEHVKEAKNLERKFTDDIRNLQRLSDQKIKSTDISTRAKKDQENLISNYENRLMKLNDEIKVNNELSSQKETIISQDFKERTKELKQTNVAKLEDNEQKLVKHFNETTADIKVRNEKHLESINRENEKNNLKQEEQIAKQAVDSKSKISSQRVEFGKVVNTLNEKNIQTISDLKDDFAKDKSAYIERSKKEYNNELVNMKEDYQKQMTIKDQANHKKLEELEKQALKIIDNYENKLSQVERKAQKEIESLKTLDQESRIKEAQARDLELSTLEVEHNSEMKNLRDRYERMIYKDRSDTEKLINKIVQRYEDQLGRERIDSQKILNLKLSEAKANFERLFKASELEKSTLRQQYEDRMSASKNA